MRRATLNGNTEGWGRALLRSCAFSTAFQSMKLRLQPLSSTTIAPASMGGKPVTQVIHLENPTNVRAQAPPAPQPNWWAR